MEEKLKELLLKEVKTKQEFEKFLKEYFALHDEIETTGSRAHINWTRWTNKKEYEEEYKKFLYEIKPLYKKYLHKIFEKIRESEFFNSLNFKRFVETKISLFKEENIEIEKKEEEFKMKYGKLNSEFVFEFKGKRLTLSEIEAKLESEKRDIRESAFKKIYENIYQKKEDINSILDNLINLRTQRAINLGFENYRDVRWKELLRFDYTPEDTDNYRKSVKKYILPLYEEFLEYLKQKLEIDELKPWDVSASIFKRGEIKLFKNQKELIDFGKEIANLIDPYFAETIEILEKNDRLDLMARENKQQGGYMSHTEDVKLPFIFMNGSGTIDNFMTFMHELGHSINYMLSRDIENPFLRFQTSEYAEVGSITMELFTLEELKNKLDEEIYKDLCSRYLSRILKLLLHIGKIDGFQHFIYLNPDADYTERENYFIELDKSLSASNVKWNGFGHLRNVIWYKQRHIFSYPFYYIDYGIATIGALNLWKIYKKDKNKALELYKKGLSIGGTKTLPETFEETGLEFKFDEPAISKISEYLKEFFKETI